MREQEASTMQTSSYSWLTSWLSNIVWLATEHVVQVQLPGLNCLAKPSLAFAYMYKERLEEECEEEAQSPVSQSVKSR